MQCYHLLNILPTICSNLSNDLYSKYIYCNVDIGKVIIKKCSLVCDLQSQLYKPVAITN